MATRLEEQLANLKHGDHACPIFESTEEQMAVAVSFIMEGLRRGERCLYIADDLMAQQVVQALAAAGMDVAREGARGAAQFLTARDVQVHLGDFAPRAMIDFLARAEAEARAEGYSGLRVLGEMTWLLKMRTDDEHVIEFEALLNQHLAGSRSIVLCHYDRSHFDLALIHDVLRTHPVAILGDLVCPNPYFEPPELVLRHEGEADAEFKRKRVEWWIAQLKAATTTEQARERAEELLRETEERLRLLLDSTAEAIYGIGQQGDCTFANRACSRLLGYAEPSALTGKNMHALTHHTRPDGTPYPEVECHIHRDYRGGEETHVEEDVFWRADGTKFFGECWSYPVRRENQIIGAVVTVLDISERKTLEQQLRQAQRMEVIGQLAGGIAHDFNNFLTAITIYSELSIESLLPEDPAWKMVQEIRNAAERSATLTRRLLAFSRKQVLVPKVISLNDVIRDTETMLRRMIGEDVELVTVLDSRLDKVKADPGQLEQILLNLAVNARDAMPQGGKLIIETNNVELDEDDAQNHTSIQPGRYVMLTVTDSGVGMSEETKGQIFEPFFTTKGQRQGTGLGLAVVLGVVKQNAGQIEVNSVLERGTSFKIYLPPVEPTAGSADAFHEPARRLQGAETILLVEDDAVLRNATRQVLQRYGYTVLEAENGDEALGVAALYRETIHLLVTDVVMPGLGGRVLAERLLALRPELKLLFMSGYTDDAIVRHGVAQDQVAFLQKPFSPVSLGKKVREVLDHQ